MKPLFKLNNDQIDKLSDIFSDVGLIALAAVALPAVFDRIDPNRIILGLIITIFCWIVSIILRK